MRIAERGAIRRTLGDEVGRPGSQGIRIHLRQIWCGYLELVEVQCGLVYFTKIIV
jgi:hypothetical protein